MASTEEPVPPTEPSTPGNETVVACTLAPIAEAKDEGAAFDVQFHPDADLEVIVEQTDADPVTYLVCASALSCASPVWRTILYDANDTSEKETRGHVKTIKLNGNPEALGFLLRIVHYDFSHLPSEPTLDQVFELGKSACQYRCTHLLYPWAKQWSNGLSQIVGQDDCYAECHKALFAAWTFGDLKLFRDMIDSLLVSTELDTNGKIVNISGEPLEDMLMPCDLLQVITTVRASTIDNILDAVKKPIHALSYGEIGQKTTYCKVGKDSQACEVMMLGSMIPALTRAGLFPVPEPGKYTGSMAQLKDNLDNLKTIPYVGREWAPHTSHEGCNLGFRESVATCLHNMDVPLSDSIKSWMSTQAKTCGIEANRELREWQSKFESNSNESLVNSELAKHLENHHIEEDYTKSEGGVKENPEAGS